MSKFEVVRGVEGFSLYLDDTRVAGQKPWSGGEVVIRWETRETYTMADNSSRWFELFGTPERAARTLNILNRCEADPAFSCDGCTIGHACDLRYFDRGAILEWLKGETE